jgi:conjugal transfer mating pair stabilization protein TraN
MAGGRAILAGFAALLAVPVALEAQTSGQAQAQSGGGYYDMGDYSYFNQPTAATPTPTPTPKPSVTSAPALSVTQAPTQSTAQAAVRAQAVQQPSAQIQAQPYVFPKGDLDKARADAKALAKPARASAASLPTSTPLTSVPGYSPAANPAEAYADDPDALTAAGNSAAGGNDAWRMVTDPSRKVVKLAPGEIAGAQEIEKDPNSFLGGQALGATDGSCKPLPSPANTDYYEATCNKGAQVVETPATCTGQMDPVVVNTLRWFYYGATPDKQEAMGFARNSTMQAKVAAGVCRSEQITKHVCDAQIDLGAGGTDVEDYRRYCKSKQSGTAQLYSCASEIPQAEIPSHWNFAKNTVYLKTEGTRSVTVTRNEGTCPAMAADTGCTAQGPEVCTSGPETRIIDGIAVTQACWAWSRPFICQRVTQSSDCSDLEGNAKCTYVRDDCLDDPQDGPCKVTSKVYRCPLPSKPSDGTEKYICGDDVYCINGDCEPVEREASTEFKDAVVGLHALGQANAEFNESTLTLFSGTRETCNKKIFGASNCCSGKGVPLLTPWLCSSAEKQLDEKDDKGLCHKLGSYCSDKVLGICVTSKDAYCCFASKLTRILQEQGRPQLGKPWGSAKKGTCEGFTIDEFSRLNLSVMDFSEVVAEFTDAAKLPDELATSTMIQQRIKDYYETRKP